MYDALHDALHSLRAAGANGFEGLILARISRLTGRRFFLAKSGAQAGKDASTAGYGATYVDIECKRYRRGASPTTRDLIGGFDEAIDAGAGRLDLRLVVSTGAIGSVEAEALRRKANREAVGVDIIDWQEAGLPQLAVLCAAFSEETPAELQARGASGDLVGVAAALKAVKDDPCFSQQRADLQRRLSAADLGLDHARAVANAWIEARLKNKADAMAAFHQALCVEDADFQPYVERAEPQASLNAWYAAWPEHHGLAAVPGREGNGKSWATMAWWKNLDARPLTLTLTSNRVTTSDALTLVASALLEQTGLRDVEFWKRRVQQWLQRPPSAMPILLLVLDGINGRPRQAWNEVFALLAASDWATRLAIVTTCRPAFWSDRVAPFLLDHLPVTQVEVQPFDDHELARAWGDRHPALLEIPKAVRGYSSLTRPSPDRDLDKDFDEIIYFDLAEDLWRGDDIYPTGREWVTDAILRWRGLPAIQALIAARCARWLGMWHTDWYPFLGTPDPDWLARQRHTVSENWSWLADSERRLADQFLLWGDAMQNATLDLPLLWHQQMNINDQDIHRAAEKNEGKLSEILFGLRISKREIAPWYRTPPMANTS